MKLQSDDFVDQSLLSPNGTNSSLITYAITEWNESSAESVNEILAADVGNAIRLVSGLVTTMNFDNLRDLDFNLDIKPIGSNVAKMYHTQ